MSDWQPCVIAMKKDGNFLMSNDLESLEKQFPDELGNLTGRYSEGQFRTIDGKVHFRQSDGQEYVVNP